jgi:hypothetical protein
MISGKLVSPAYLLGRAAASVDSAACATEAATVRAYQRRSFLRLGGAVSLPAVGDCVSDWKTLCQGRLISLLG